MPVIKNMWKTISSKEIFHHSRITLIEDEVELPNGHKTKYLTYKKTSNAATVICVNSERKILLQKEYNYPSGLVLLQFPGGSVPLDEDIAVGANRELMEEAGLYATKIKQIGKYLMNNRRSEAYMYVFLAEEFEEKSLPADIEESLESYWFTVAEIDRMILEGEIQNPHLLACWSLYKLLPSTL